MYIQFSECADVMAMLHGKRPKRVLHIGAHIGEEASAYFEAGVTHVLWGEANTDLVPTLRENIEKFNMNQVILPFGFFDENKELTFNIANNMQSSSLYEMDLHEKYYTGIKFTSARTIQCYRLDALIDAVPAILPWSDFDFINIDTQGAELSILKGLGRHIESPGLKAIYLEVNSEPLYRDIPLVQEIDVYLMKFGFHRLISAWTNAGWGDALYLRNVVRSA